MAHKFVVYIDESGDEGFKFDTFPKGSTHWFVLSALIVTQTEDARIRELAADIRQACGFKPKHVLHFADLGHDRRVRAIQKLADAKWLTATSLIVNKRRIESPDIFIEQPFRLYFYATRLLLERVSWFCRDYALANGFDSCAAKVIFEHRRRLSYGSLRDYLTTLRSQAQDDAWMEVLLNDVRIHWGAIEPTNIEAEQKPRYAGLQLADCVASGTRWALERRYDTTEHRFAKTLKPIVYKRNGNYTSYGLKFFPVGIAEDDPCGHWIRKHFI